MKFNQKLVHGKFVKRYKRFLTDIELDDGSLVVAHCTNSGSMKSCLEEEFIRRVHFCFPKLTSGRMEK